MCVCYGFTIEVYGFMHSSHTFLACATHDVNREMEVDLMGYHLLVVFAKKKLGNFNVQLLLANKTFHVRQVLLLQH